MSFTEGKNKEACIVLKGIQKKYGNHIVLDDINIEVPFGAVYGLLGPSGCGKTTTVKLVAGISEATQGEVIVLERTMPDLALMNQIGYMAQSDALYGDLTAKENLKFFGQLYGMSKAELEKRIVEAAEVVGLVGDLHKIVCEFSGGMKRRLSLAMAILHRPKILILDEPTVGIDPKLRRNIWAEIRKMTEAGVTVMVTTHVMDEAEKCSHLVMMRDGKLIAHGTPTEIKARAGTNNIEEAFIYFAEDGAKATYEKEE